MASFIELPTPLTAFLGSDDIGSRYACGKVPIVLTVGGDMMHTGALRLGWCESTGWAKIAQACQDKSAKLSYVSIGCNSGVKVAKGILTLSVDTGAAESITLKLSAAACAPAFLEAAAIDARIGGRTAEQIEADCDAADAADDAADAAAGPAGNANSDDDAAYAASTDDDVADTVTAALAASQLD